MLDALSQRRLERDAAGLAEHYTRVYGRCPHCGLDIGTHEFLDLASARPWIAGSRHAEMKAAVSRRDWNAAERIREWDAGDDAILLHVIRCQRSGAGLLLEVESFFEPFFDDRVVSRELLTAVEVHAIAEAVGQRPADVLAIMRTIRAARERPAARE